MLKKILIVLLIIQFSAFFIIHSSFAEEDNVFPSNLKDNEKNIVLFGNFLANEEGLNVIENVKKNNPDLIFFLGDLGYDIPKNIFALVDELGKEKISVIIGNHDRDNTKEILAHYGLNREFYSINYEEIHFIVLASDLDYAEDSEQIKFLKNDLKEANNNPKIKWKIVLIHKPMIYKDYYVKNNPDLTKGVALKEGLQPILDKYQVDMVISGHVHLYERSFPLKFDNNIISDEKYNYINPEGTIHIIAGTAGAEKHHNKHPPTFEEWAVIKNPDVYGFLNLRIPDNGEKLIFEFITNDGYVLDQFQIYRINDFIKADLVGADLSGADLSGADLVGADLSGADLSGADLSGADLSGADLVGADLKNVKLNNANLENSNLYGVNLSKSIFYKTDLTNADFSFTNLENVDFSNMNLKDVKLIGAYFNNVDLSGMDLSGKNLAGASFVKTNMINSNLNSSNLSWTYFNEVKFFETNFENVKLVRANLENSDLSQIKLSYSDLSYANLSKIDFTNVKLENMQLSKTNLSYSNFSNVDLSGRDMSETNLYGVDLIGKDLRGANFKNANFMGYEVENDKEWKKLTKANDGGVVDLIGIDKNGKELFGTDLSLTDLRGANLEGVNLSGFDISHANLSNLDFSNTNIEKANLTKSDLSGADLSNTNLSQVRLSEANLTNADLTNADFTDMNFFKFEFFGTDLSGADLTGADLTGADLEWGFFYGLNLSDTVLECFNNSICK